MKNLLKSIFTMALMNFSAFGQDTITLRSGEIINANIIELTSISVRYRRVDEVEGPIRNVELNQVAAITYEDGKTERFVLVEDKESVKKEISKERPDYPKRRGPDRILEGKDRILEGGLFIDLLPGYATDDNVSSNRIGYGARLGQKWYYGKGEKWRPGLQVTWVRLNLYPIRNGEYSTDIAGMVSPLGIGFTNAFKFKEKRGLEVNASIAPVIQELPLPGFSSGRFGAFYGMDVKYRLDRFAIGLDYSRAQQRSSNLNMVSITQDLNSKLESVYLFSRNVCQRWIVLGAIIFVLLHASLKICNKNG